MLEPAAAIGKPPTDGEDWNGGGESPPEREDNVRSQTQDGERQPEHLALHAPSLHCCERGCCDRQQIPPDDPGITDVGDSQCGKFPIAIAIVANEHCEQLCGYQ